MPARDADNRRKQRSKSGLVWAERTERGPRVYSGATWRGDVERKFVVAGR